MPTNLIPTEHVYSDFLIDFDIHPTRGDLVRAVNESAVKRSIRNLIMTGRTERPFRPYLGGGIRKFLFEQMHPQVAHALKREIEQTIATFEPRAKALTVNVNPNYDQDSYDVKIVFYIINTATPTSVDLTLERIR